MPCIRFWNNSFRYKYYSTGKKELFARPDYGSFAPGIRQLSMYCFFYCSLASKSARAPRLSRQGRVEARRGLTALQLRPTPSCSHPPFPTIPFSLGDGGLLSGKNSVSREDDGQMGRSQGGRAVRDQLKCRLFLSSLASLPPFSLF